MKKLVCLILALAMMLSFAACGVNVSTTNTTTTTNADGSTTTTTTTTNNGVVSTTETTSQTMGQLCEDGEQHDFVLVFENNSDIDFSEFYITEAGATECTNDLEDGETFAAGTTVEIPISTDNTCLTFDFGFRPADSDDQVWFSECDLSEFDAENGTIEIKLSDDGWHLLY